MRFTKLTGKKSMLLLIAFFSMLSVIAQDAATTAPVTKSGYNMLAILLIFIAIILAFVIWGMGQVLIVLSKQALDKEKQSAQKTPVTPMLIFFLLVSQIATAQEVTNEVVKTIPNYGGLSANTFYMFAITIMTEVVAIFFLTFLIRRMQKELQPEPLKAAKKESKLSEWWASLDKKLFTKAIPVEKEADIMLDHDYDGIKELDNALPPWWKYGFYFTIIVGVIYLFNFHVFGTGKNPTEEYIAEVETARIEKDAFEAKNKDKIDETNITMANSSGLAIGKDLYIKKCLACHGAKGEGGAGPNLTDDYWLHKGSLNDIYRTIKNGYPDKGMQSWATEFTPKEMSFITSYIKTMKGTNPPNPKAPQGEKYSEETAVVADSLKTNDAKPIDTLKTSNPKAQKK